MDEPTFSFLVTTDNHLGFKEDDHIRRKDSYMAFKEALEVARQRDVDFILLGGDLFHMNNPSASIEHKCIKIIRQHMNAKTKTGPSFKRIKGNYSHFSKVNHANYEDPNLTVPYPIMTIHGNHDDPTGPNSQSVCSKLATSGLLNYFGEVTSVKDIVIEPIILEKDGIRIALYGLGFIPDVKLKAAFERGEISFKSPPKGTFNVLVVHQNRANYQEHNFLPDDIFPDFIHLLIRGHEHATQSPEPLPGSKVNGMAYQPGSTVATSITIMEAAPKKIGLIKVKKNPAGSCIMDYELISLRCCRRMLFKDITHKDIRNYVKSNSSKSDKLTAHDFKEASKQYVNSCIIKLLEDNKEQVGVSKGIKRSKASSKQKNIVEYMSKSTRASRGKVKSASPDPPLQEEDELSPEDLIKLKRFDLPLVRIRIEYTKKSERFDEREISTSFYPTEVANKDIVLFKKQKVKVNEAGDVEYTTFLSQERDVDEEEEDIEFVDIGEEKRETIDVMIENYFKDKKPDERLQLLSLEEYTQAVRGTGEGGNVISKVLNQKKHEVFDKFKKVIADEESAAMYHNMDRIQYWFSDALCKQEEEVKMILEDPDSDVIICD